MMMQIIYPTNEIQNEPLVEQKSTIIHEVTDQVKNSNHDRHIRDESQIQGRTTDVLITLNIRSKPE
jgi:hypothetical protein